MSVQSEKITFPGSQGHALAARLDLPAGRPRAYALFAHCFACSKEVFAASRVSTALAAKGIAVLRFDFTGLGASEGDFAETSFSSNVADLKAAARYLEERAEAPKLLVGHSLGGAAVLAAAPGLTSVKAVATIAAPAGPDHVQHLFRGSIDEILETGEAEVDLGGHCVVIGKGFIEDIKEQNLLEGVKTMKKALIVFHSPLDEIVGVENAGKIFAAAKHPKSFVSLDRADHMLSRKADAVYVADVISAWASRFLEEEEGVDRLPATEPGTVLVMETGEGRFTNWVNAGRHILKADEPASIPGGKDSGLSPYDYILAGLGACTSMTLRMYAEHKKIPLEKISVRLRHAKVHAEDCADCETKEGQIDRIEREITLEGNLDEATRTRLLEIAEKCPVHRTLHGEVKVVSKLRER